jgi:hypothetical protein
VNMHGGQENERRSDRCGQDGTTCGVNEKLTEAWWVEIENSGARGRFKKALSTWVDHDVWMMQESLRDASPEVQQAWLDFAPTWAKAESGRLLKDLIARFGAVKARRKKGRLYGSRAAAKVRRGKLLRMDIVEHVRSCGGSVPFAPAAVAKAISSSRRSLSANRVRGHMHQMIRQGQARQIGKGVNLRFALPVRAAPKA